MDDKDLIQSLMRRIEALEQKRIYQEDMVPGSIMPRALDASSANAAGDLYYSDGKKFIRLPAGSNGQVLVMSDGVPAWSSTTPSARVYNTLAQSIPNAAVTKLTFDTERFDTNSMHDLASNTGRLTIRTAGIYMVGATVGFAANTTGIRAVRLFGNNSFYIGMEIVSAASADITILTPVTMYNFAVGDYVEVDVLQSSGGALDVNAAFDYTAEFWITKVAPSPA